jgi:hypothetical protein
MSDELTHEEEEERLDKACKDKIFHLINNLFNELNYMGNEKKVEEAVLDAIQHQHRTLQQQFFGHVILAVIKDFAKRHDEGQFDMRNEESCKAAKRMEALAKTTYLPFI